jgi:hypothetical protein
MNKSLLAAAAIFLACASWSCDEKLSSIAGPTPNLEPTFASIQHDIFESSDSGGQRLACTNCHTSTGRNPAAGLNLNHDVAYDQLVNVTSRTSMLRVRPGDADNSYLIRKLAGGPGIIGARMPLNSPSYLTDGQIMIIRRWIAIGAPRN